MLLGWLSPHCSRSWFDSLLCNVFRVKAHCIHHLIFTFPISYGVFYNDLHSLDHLASLPALSNKNFPPPASFRGRYYIRISPSQAVALSIELTTCLSLTLVVMG